MVFLKHSSYYTFKIINGDKKIKIYFFFSVTGFLYSWSFPYIIITITSLTNSHKL